MNADVAVAMIAAIRSQLDALELMLDVPVPGVPSGPCEHPEDKREPCAAMGAPNQFMCRACVTLVNPDAPEGQE